MLGSLIVQMPPTCRECRFFIQAFGYLCVGEEDCTDAHRQWLRQHYAGERPDWCPLQTEFPSVSGREFISPEEFHKHIATLACPRDFGFETEYMAEWCPPDFHQGDCKRCWDSKVVKTDCVPNGVLDEG